MPLTYSFNKLCVLNVITSLGHGIFGYEFKQSLNNFVAYTNWL